MISVWYADTESVSDDCIHLCPGLSSTTTFKKLTIFCDGLAKTANFAKLMIFLDDLAKTTKISRWRCKNCKICKLTVFRNDPAIHYTCNYCSVLTQLCLIVKNFFWVKTLHMICLKLGLNVTNFQGTGPWSKMQILTAVHLEIDSSRRKEIFFHAG